MKKLSKKTVFFTIAIAAIALCVIIYLAAPGYLFNAYFDSARKSAGLQIKTIDIPGFKIVYAEGGSGEPILLLHGFGGNKDNWLLLAPFLTPGYRVIIPDLPGFGDSSKPRDKSYKIAAQVQRVDQLLTALKYGKVHIVGNSMGGSIAGMYAATYPQKVKSLALFDSGGVAPPVKSELALLLEKGINPLVVRDVSDYDRLLEINFFKPPQIPSMIKKYMTAQAIKAAPLNDQIFKELMQSDMWVLENSLHKITAPTLILWGDSDKVLHISAVDVFSKSIKNAKVAIIRNCGHLPMLERPKETAAEYQAFLRQVREESQGRNLK